MADGSKTDHNTDEFMWISKVANNQYKVESDRPKSLIS